MTALQSDHRTVNQPHHLHPSAWAAEAKALVILALPMIATQLAQMAILTTDVILLGRVGRDALASAAIGNTLYYFAWLIGMGPAAAVSPMIAHSLGAHPKDKAGVRAAVRMGFWATGLISIPMMVFMLFARPILLALGQEPQLAHGAGIFVATLVFGLPFSFGFNVLRNFSAALEKPNAALWVMGGSIVWNAVAAWTLIFGHFGLPAMGLVGSGIATASSAVFAFAAMLIIVWMDPKLRSYRVFRRFFHPSRRKLAEVLRLGLPIGLTMIFEAMLFNAATLVMGHFGAATVAAHQIALNFASVTFMVPLGLGMAATIRVGVAAGAGRLADARQAGFVAMGVSLAFISLVAVGMALFGRQIAGLYFGENAAANAEVVALASTFLLVAAAFQVFDALQVTGAMALRGLKDAKWPMWLAGGSYWLAGAPTCVMLGFGFHMQGLGVWIGLAFGLAVAATAMTWRFWWITRD